MNQQNGTGHTSTDLSPQKRDSMVALSVTALGVVFGDIGTSPLYALRECFSGTHGMPVNPGNVLGIVSLMIWTLTIVVCIKYVSFVMRADNQGEGGILALMTRVTNVIGGRDSKRYGIVIALGILGASLLFGDGIITPAITVLGAVEGLEVGTKLFAPFVVPISIGILVALFLVQSKGTARVGLLFGPILAVWFIVIGVLGFNSILAHPAILAAINPWYAVRFIIDHGMHSFTVFGSIFLAVTGAEMLYADLGHFGRKPIRLAWFCVAFPGLLFNYMGQGAYLLTSPQNVENLFFRICPQWFLYPMIALATAAAMIASQAVISGAFSLARQSVQLGFWPRIQILHTSSRQIGQVYVPLVNWVLLGGTVLLILGFRKSGNLAAAYGIAVSVDMFITAVLITIVAHKVWRIPLPILIPLATAMLAMDATFFCANVLKIRSGGWIVLVIASSAYVLMRTWLKGRESLRRSVALRSIDIQLFVDDVKRNKPLRVPGVAMFLTGNPNGVPGALLHNMKHNMVLHEHTVILSVTTVDIPFVPPLERSKMESLDNGIYKLQLSYGFSENPDIPAALKSISFADFEYNPMRTTFFLGREALVVTKKKPIPVWRKRLFWFMSHNATTATSFFNLPHNRVVELGAQIEL